MTIFHPFSRKPNRCVGRLKARILKNQNFVEAISLLGENWSVNVDDGTVSLYDMWLPKREVGSDQKSLRRSIQSEEK